MNRSINKFRLASRELFNTYFLETLSKDQNNWDYLEQFDIVQESLFSALVSVPHEIGQIIYGFPQPEILVKVASETGAPIMLNRDINSGYWDDPIDTASPNAVFTFVSFFDWDQMNYKDNRYARVIVLEWPENAHLVGKHALIETHYITFEKA